MAHTDRTAPWKPYNRESRRNRRLFNRRQRAHARAALRCRDYVRASERRKGTEGWMTW